MVHTIDQLPFNDHDAAMELARHLDKQGKLDLDTMEMILRTQTTDAAMDKLEAALEKEGIQAKSAADLDKG
jgi:hypothetical protein